ncbi:hypothetical protein TrLO_g14918 [Triparma laevis f. longispina]|uniref:BspA family leucine-rich repeat surface protein n=1 Tax=Triparma laevis f. longispina TaxID=1714387 RepID=A0A9W7AMY6_9STRA|nr:hypothetical protein TrLO_g14918 [Triparma laevis f. longispina]
MRWMFGGCESFDQDLSGRNVENCKNMYSMFYGAEKFNKDSVKNWNLGGKNTANMFENGAHGANWMKWIKERKFVNTSFKVAVKKWCDDSGAAEVKY